MLPSRGDATQAECLSEKYERRLERERRARREAEELLEAKSRELYVINQKLQRLALELEQRVTERTRDLALAERKALSLAERDQLTGIANRMVFSRMSEEAISTARKRRSCFALLLIDLDNFKHVNDGFGHDVGDRLLCEVADRIVRATRSPDCVARLGGDEFAVLADNCAEPSGLSTLARRIIDIVGQPIKHRGHVVEPSCSIGIAVYPDHAVDAPELQRLADLALYKAKGAGRGNFAIFDDHLRRAYDERHALGSDLKAALARGDVEPWFQPIVDAQNGKLVGVEGLARWNHPTKGCLPPFAFLSIAEERGLTNDLFVCMLRAACRKTLPWIAKGLIRRVALNVSPSQFRSSQLADIVGAVLLAESFPPSGLSVEITEDLLLNDMTRARVQLEQLASTGIRIALDDFGVGYSNIGYLRHLPIHQLKLDRVLTADICVDPKARTILSAILEIARTLGLTVVAEGVETPAQAAWLSHIGCNKLQGFHYGRPMPWEQLTASWSAL